MMSFIETKRMTLPYRVLSALVAFTFAFSLIVPPTPVYAQQAVLNLPAPGTLLSVSQGFIPAMVRGITIHLDNPLRFDFIIDPGDDNVQGEELREESTKMIKYFLAALTVPEEEIWVNLSPYEEGKVIPEKFGDTEMGRDLLAQDYLLKQLGASLMYPEDDLGKEFWDKVYQKAYEKYGTTDIPINTFNKVWIVPETAVVHEHETGALVLDSHLKVMMEEDFLALEKNLKNEELGTDKLEEAEVGVISGVSSQVVREVLLPAIEKEVNEGRIFANLRQIYNSMILATWYKIKLKDSLLGQVYVDKSMTKGVDTEDKQINQKIYNQYLEAFKDGVYNYIKEDYDPHTQMILRRKYFSGGFTTSSSIGRLRDIVRKALIPTTVLVTTGAAMDPVQAQYVREFKEMVPRVEFQEISWEARETIPSGVTGLYAELPKKDFVRLAKGLTDKYHLSLPSAFTVTALRETFGDTEVSALEEEHHDDFIWLIRETVDIFESYYQQHSHPAEEVEWREIPREVLGGIHEIIAVINKSITYTAGATGENNKTMMSARDRRLLSLDVEGILARLENKERVWNLKVIDTKTDILLEEMTAKMKESYSLLGKAAPSQEPQDNQAKREQRARDAGERYNRMLIEAQKEWQKIERERIEAKDPATASSGVFDFSMASGQTIEIDATKFSLLRDRDMKMKKPQLALEGVRVIRLGSNGGVDAYRFGSHQQAKEVIDEYFSRMDVSMDKVDAVVEVDLSQGIRSIYNERLRTVFSGKTGKGADIRIPEMVNTNDLRKISNQAREIISKTRTETRTKAIAGSGIVAVDKVASSATTHGIAGERNLGGIKLDPALLDLQIKRDGNGVALPVAQQPIAQMRIEGFFPVIIEISPLQPNTLLPLLGLIEQEESSETPTQQSRQERNPFTLREPEDV